MTRLFFNEDLNHFVYTRAINDIDVGKEEILAFIDQYKDSGITDFIINTSDSIAWYQSKRGENILDHYEKLLKQNRIKLDDQSVIVKYLKLIHRIYREKNLDMYKMWIERLRQIGINPWISIRMNDIHNYNDKDHILHSDFFHSGKNIRRGDHRPYGNQYDNAFDFMNEDVRHHCMEIIKDALETFDMYGLELDWMREIYSIRIGREYEGQKVINCFMEQIYLEVKKAEERYGHTIKIGVRLPSSPQKSLALGFDFFDWVENGYIDLITVTPRWSSSDNLMPVDLWKKILKNTSVTLAAGLEILIDSYNRPGRKYMFNSFETAVGTAAGYFGLGADAIYLFNYMDGVNGKYFTSDLELCTNPDLYMKFLNTVSDNEACYKSGRRHLVTFNDVFAPGVNEFAPLPLKLSGSQNNSSIEYKYLRIPTGEIPQSLTPNFVIGVEKGVAIDDLSVYINAEKLASFEKTVLPMPCNTDLDYYAYSIRNDYKIPAVSVIEMGTAGNDIVIHWAEIRLV